MDNQETIDTTEVVMRKPKNVFGPGSRHVENSKAESCCSSAGGVGDGAADGKKRVKWSESTELRERLKVYRRSQLDIPLDYQHIAAEEEREREGVREWRSSLLKNDDDDDDDDDSNVNNGSKQEDAVDVATNDDVDDDTAASTDSDENEVVPDDLEKRLQDIREITTRYTMYPAYAAAVTKYQEYLSDSENTSDLTGDQLTAMTSQMGLYKQVVELYKEWTRPDEPVTESRFSEIISLLQEATNLGPPPQSVADIIKSVMTDEENSQKQVDAYNDMVQKMIAAFEGLNTSTGLEV